MGLKEESMLVYKDVENEAEIFRCMHIRWIPFFDAKNVMYGILKNLLM